MVLLVVADIRLSVRLVLTSMAHEYQGIWVFISGSALHVVDRRAYECSSSFWLTSSQKRGHKNSEDASVDVREVDTT